jgi:hypothetical protein
MNTVMFKIHRLNDKSNIAELISKEFIINDVQDAVDLLAESGSADCSSIIILLDNLDKRFFDLKTGFAGEILQKFSNYRVRLAIVGDFAGYTSKSLREFIRESNRGGLIIFCDTVSSALKKFKDRNIR